MAKVMTKEQIMEKLDNIDYIQRCYAANICPFCGSIFEVVASLRGHTTVVACDNDECAEYKKAMEVV